MGKFKWFSKLVLKKDEYRDKAKESLQDLLKREKIEVKMYWTKMPTEEKDCENIQLATEYNYDPQVKIESNEILISFETTENPKGRKTPKDCFRYHLKFLYKTRVVFEGDFLS